MSAQQITVSRRRVVSRGPNVDETVYAAAIKIPTDISLEDALSDVDDCLSKVLDQKHPYTAAITPQDHTRNPPLNQKRPIVSKEGNFVEIEAPYSTEFVNRIKQIPGRRWDTKQKLWRVPSKYEYQACKIAHECFPPTDQSIEEWKESVRKGIMDAVASLLPKTCKVKAYMKEELNGHITISIFLEGEEDQGVEVVVQDDNGLRSWITDDEAAWLATFLANNEKYRLELAPFTPPSY